MRVMIARRRSVVALAVIGLVVVVAGSVFLILWRRSGAHEVSTNAARKRFEQSSSSSVTEPATNLAVRPAAGVYVYRGSGTEHLSLPPKSQAQGPQMPGTVLLTANGCWTFRIDYSSQHWQTWNYCPRGGGLVELGGQTFERWAGKTGRIADSPGCEVVLFQTCFVQNNDPQLGKDTISVFEKNAVDIKCVRGLCCCGMPAWEKGDLKSLQAQAKQNLKILAPFVEKGAKVIVINPTCSMMFRREYPELVGPEDREVAGRISQAVMDPSEFLWSIREEARFSVDFKSTPGGTVAYHAPCHLRAQAIGFRGRDLLRKIPGVKPVMVQECCGHNGTFAMTVEGFEPSRRIGKKAFDAMHEANATLWSTDCPLAAIQFRQHAGSKPMHPMSILARAYRQDGFDKKL